MATSRTKPAADKAAGQPSEAEQPAADDTAPAEDAPREPSAQDAPPAAAPLEAPRRRVLVAPETRTVEPNAARRVTPDDGHVALVDDDGNELGPDDLFEEINPHFTYVRAAQRIHQKFKYPGTSTVTTQLVYPRGAHVPRDQAEQLRHTVRLQHQRTAAGGG